MSNSVDKLYDIVDKIYKFKNMDFDSESQQEQYKILLSELEEFKSELEDLQKLLLEDDIKYYESLLDLLML